MWYGNFVVNIVVLSHTMVRWYLICGKKYGPTPENNKSQQRTGLCHAVGKEFFNLKEHYLYIPVALYCTSYNKYSRVVVFTIYLFDRREL